MSVDVPAAKRFIYTSARLLDRHRAAVLLHDAPIDPVLTALRSKTSEESPTNRFMTPTKDLVVNCQRLGWVNVGVDRGVFVGTAVTVVDRA